MKTGSPLVRGWILLGLCLSLSPALSVAQDRSSRGFSISLGRKPEVRRYSSPTVRRETPPPGYQSGWLSPNRRVVSTTSTQLSASRPQAMAASTTVTRISSSYGTASRTVRYNEVAPSTVSFLPDGTVVTREATYTAPTLAPMDDTMLNQVENPLTPSYGQTTTSVQFPNSAMAPPPPPMPSPPPRLPEVSKADLSNVLSAERVSPGMVKSPYPPYSLLDVQGLRSGSLAQDPASKKLFRVP